MSVARYRELIASGEITWPKSGKSAKLGAATGVGGKGRHAAGAVRPGRSASQSSSGAARERRASPEEDLQRLCFGLVEALTPRHPLLKYLMHVPNGGARSKGEAGKLKAMGTRPGVPDFLLPRASGLWRGLAIELKSDTGRTSEEQKFWLRGLEGEGYLVSVCRSLEEFEELLMAFLNRQPEPGCVERGW